MPERIPTISSAATIELRGNPLTIADVWSIASRKCAIQLTDQADVKQRMQASADVVQQAVRERQRVYGVTTGFGSMVDVSVPEEHASASQNNLLAFLSTGAGDPIDRRHTRAAMALRANMLLRGMSGVRWEIVDRLFRFLDVDAIPVVRELGSIGASGDLVPLGAIARAITGQGAPIDLAWNQAVIDGQDVLAQLDLEPLSLHPKEALAIVNGTTFSAAIAANCVQESRVLTALTLAINAIMVRALLGHCEPFEPFVHQCKPHPGQVWTAQVLRELLASEESGNSNGHAAHVQDRYSLRCLPQYYGPLVESLSRVGQVVETEMNAVTDNPLIDPDNKCFYQSGNFLGQYIGLSMDDLRRTLGLMAKHLDIQIAQLVSPEFSQGLPASLQGNSDLSYNMGLKGLQITGNSIMPLLIFNGNPLVEHFPAHAEQYNQNVNGLSWGAANLAWKSVEMFQRYIAISLLFAVQAIDLRAHRMLGHFDGRALLGTTVRDLYESVYAALDVASGEAEPLVFNDADRPLEHWVDELGGQIVSRGQLTAAVEPVMESFERADLQC